jgi:hypothetical protein
MMHEQNFLCWLDDQNESEGKEILANSIRLAAKRALAEWHQEDSAQMRKHKVTINVKDSARRVHSVILGGINLSEKKLPHSFTFDQESEIQNQID